MVLKPREVIMRLKRVMYMDAYVMQQESHASSESGR